MVLQINPDMARTNSKSLVYQTLKKNIMELILYPGQIINEGDVGNELHVSRTPVREAFIRLNEEHLIQTYPQRGSYISKIDMRLVEEGSFMRSCLEKAVYAELALAIEKDTVQELRQLLAIQKATVQSDADYSSAFMELDNRFHQHLFASCKKNDIWDAVVSLNTHYDRLRFLELKERVNIYKVLFQHEMMIDAIENHEAEKVRQLVEDHKMNVSTIMDMLSEKYQDYFM